VNQKARKSIQGYFQIPNLIGGDRDLDHFSLQYSDENKMIAQIMAKGEGSFCQIDPGWDRLGKLEKVEQSFNTHSWDHRVDYRLEKQTKPPPILESLTPPFGLINSGERGVTGLHRLVGLQLIKFESVFSKYFRGDTQSLLIAYFVVSHHVRERKRQGLPGAMDTHPR
jgi:hypothetical protein